MAEFPAFPLLMTMLRAKEKENRLPDDDELLARYTGLTKGQWNRIAPVVREFFDAHDGTCIKAM